MEMTIKEYAESRKISYEAVRKQVKDYKKKELKTHVTYQGRQAYLDDYAVDFLDQHRQKRNIVLYPTNKEIEEEMARLRNQVFQLQAELLKRTDTITELLESKTQLLEEKTKLIEDMAQKEMLEKDNAELKQELSKYQRTVFGLYRKIES